LQEVPPISPSKSASQIKPNSPDNSGPTDSEGRRSSSVIS